MIVAEVSNAGATVSGLMEFLLSFLRARLSAAAANSLSSPVLVCFRALLHFVRSAARPSQDILSMSTTFISLTQNFYIAGEGGRWFSSPKPAHRRGFWNATILHTADMTQPSQSALSKQSVHTGKTSTSQTSALVILSCQDILRIRRMFLRWNVLSLLSCPAYVVRVSLPYINVPIT